MTPEMLFLICTSYIQCKVDHNNTGRLCMISLLARRPGHPKSGHNSHWGRLKNLLECSGQIIRRLTATSGQVKSSATRPTKVAEFVNDIKKLLGVVRPELGVCCSLAIK